MAEMSNHEQRSRLLTAAGHLLRNSGRPADAEGLYREAAHLDSANPTSVHFLGDSLAERGMHKEALSAYSDAAQLGMYTQRQTEILVRVLNHAGLRDEANKVLHQWVARHPDDPRARHMLAACGNGPAPDRAADDYVTSTFDSYAETFDESLAQLNYRAPELIVDAVGRSVGEPRARLRVLDAGCGTGLCGAGLRPFASALTGVDLSGRMLERARSKGQYDGLVQTELTAFLESNPQRFDVIASADVLIYFGDLKPILEGAAAALVDGATMVFSLEAARPGSGPFYLQENGRFAHTAAYVRQCAAQADLAISELDAVNLRTEVGEPVEGLVVTARKANQA